MILGLDPGTAATGFGVIHVAGNRLKALEFGVVETVAGMPLEQRLQRLYQKLFLYWSKLLYERDSLFRHPKQKDNLQEMLIFIVW